jgi:hypothetical protein
MRFSASSYCNLLCYVWLISLRGLLFSEEKRRTADLGKRGSEWVGTGKRGGRGNCGRGVLYERIKEKNMGKGRQLLHNSNHIVLPWRQRSQLLSVWLLLHLAYFSNFVDRESSFLTQVEYSACRTTSFIYEHSSRETGILCRKAKQYLGVLHCHQIL